MTEEQKTERLLEHTEQIAENTADIKELFHRVQTLEQATGENTKAIANMIAENREQFKRIETLETLAGDIKSLTESTHNIALSTRDIKNDLEHVVERIDIIENDKRSKGFAVWQMVVGGIIGAVITFIASFVLGG